MLFRIANFHLSVSEVRLLARLNQQIMEKASASTERRVTVLIAIRELNRELRDKDTLKVRECLIECLKSRNLNPVYKTSGEWREIIEGADEPRFNDTITVDNPRPASNNEQVNQQIAEEDRQKQLADIQDRMTAVCSNLPKISRH
jgi:hypothetical protein